MRHNIAQNWRERLKNLKHDHLVHLVILPFYNEQYDTVAKGLQSLIQVKTDPRKIAVVLAIEQRRRRGQEHCYSGKRKIRQPL